jgi:FlaA1/EpsC-like NDP-sugar epimerase
LVVGDVLAVVGGFIAAFAIRAASPVSVAHPMEWNTYAVLLVSIIPFWLVIFALLGLYNTNIYERRFAEAGRLATGSFIGLLFMVSWDYMSLEALFPAKLVPVYGFVITWVLLLSFRNLLRIARTALFAYGVGLTRIAIVGNTPITKELVESLKNPKQSGYKLLGLVGYRKTAPAFATTFPTFQAFLASRPQTTRRGKATRAKCKTGDRPKRPG